jgi:hypothetical protein
MHARDGKWCRGALLWLCDMVRLRVVEGRLREFWILAEESHSDDDGHLHFQDIAD